MLYVVPISDDHILTHDGVSQLGSFHCSLEWFTEHVQVEYQITYWSPDVYSNRYPRSNYQRHLLAAGKCSLESNSSEWSRRGNL